MHIALTPLCRRANLYQMATNKRACSDAVRPRPVPPAEENAHRGRWWIIAVIAAAVIPYLPSLKGGFVLDDWHLIVRSPIAHSLLRIPDAFTHGFLPEVFGEDLVYYRPLVTISYQLNYALSGLDPLAYRLTNIFLNALVALLVFALARRLMRSDMAAGVAGVTFAVLPNHSEAVAWISGRTDIMAALFILAGLIVFIDTCRQGFTWSRGIGCGALFFCGLLSKENALALPVLMAVYVWIFGAGPNRRDIARWVAVFIFPLVVYLILRKLYVGAAVDKHIFYMLRERLMGVGIAYATYMRMLFVPMEARVLYDVFPIGIKYPALALAAWSVPAGLIWLCVWLRKRAQVVAFGTFWIFFTLLPVSNILPTSGPLPAERFAYLASVGSSLILGWIILRAYSWQPESLQIWKPLVIALVAWFAVYGTLLTISGSRFYFSNLGWARGVSETNTRFAMFRSQAGQYFAEAGLLKEAAREYSAAAKLQPEEKAHSVELAKTLTAMGQPEQATEVLNDALERFGSQLTIEYNLGIAHAVNGNFLEAEQAFERATKLRPDSAECWRKLAKARLKLKDHAGAVEAYEKIRALGRLTPDDERELRKAREK